LSFIESPAISYHRRQTGNKVSTRFIFGRGVAASVPGAISQLQDLLARGCKVKKVEPAMFASDAEVNVVTVTVTCPDGTTHAVRAYREEAQALREFVRKM
jgi:hypothetical protein